MSFYSGSRATWVGLLIALSCVVSLPVCGQVSPTALSFSYTIGGTVPVAQTVKVSNSGSFSTSVSLTNGTGWLSATPTTFSAPGSISVSVQVAALNFGTYTGSVNLQGPGSTKFTVPVTLTVVSPSSGPLIVPPLLRFRYRVDEPMIQPASQSAAVQTTNGPSVAFSVTARQLNPADPPWIGISNTAGTGSISRVPPGNNLQAATPSLLDISVDPSSLTPGVYLAWLTFTTASTPKVNSERGDSAQATPACGSPAPVGQNTLVVIEVGGAGSPLFSFPDNLTLTTGVGSTLTVGSLSPQQFPFTVVPQTSPDGWLCFDTGGISNLATTMDLTLKPSLNPAVTAPNAYNGTVAILDAQGQTQAVTEVTFVATSAPPGTTGSKNGEKAAGSQQGVVTADQTLLAFSAPVGGSSPPLLMNVATTDGSTVTASTAKKSAWLTVSAPGGWGGMTDVRVSVNANGLTQGNYSDLILLTAPGSGNQLSVPVTMQVVAASSPEVRTGLFPQIANGGGWRSSITLINTGTADANVTLNVVGGDGKALKLPFAGGFGTVSQIKDKIPAHGTRTYATAGGLAGLLTGWVEFITDGAVGGHATLRRVPVGQTLEYLATVPLTLTSPDRLTIPFDNTNGLITTVSVINPNSSTAIIQAIVRDYSGNKIDTMSYTVPARGQSIFYVNEKFQSSQGQQGVVELLSPNVPVSAVGFRYQPGGSISYLPASTDADLEGRGGRHILPMILDGWDGSGFWQSSIYVTNADVTNAAFQTNVVDASGVPAGLGFQNLGQSVSWIRYAEYPLESDVITTFGNGPQATLSWTESLSRKYVDGLAVLGYNQPNAPYVETTMPWTRHTSGRVVFPLDNTAGNQTYASLVNAGDGNAHCTLIYRDSAGKTIGTESVDLPGRNQALWALPGSLGTVEVTAPGGIAAGGLLVTGSGAFTAIPLVVP